MPRHPLTVALLALCVSACSTPFLTSETAMTQRSPFTPPQASEVATDVLEVVGLGLSLEQFRPNNLWRRIEAYNGRYILPDERKQYPPDGQFSSYSDGRRGDALEYAMTHWAPKQREQTEEEFVESYPLPTIMATPTLVLDVSTFETMGNPPKRGEAAFKNAAIKGELARSLRHDAGMRYHELDIRELVMTPYNDILWATLFSNFDRRPTLNSMMLHAEEGYSIRSDIGGWENQRNEDYSSIVRRPKRVTDYTETFVSLIFARRKSVDWLRDFAPYVRDYMEHLKFPNGQTGRGPTGFGGWKWRWSGEPPQFIADADVPQAWTEFQLTAYDRLPTLAYVYRPQMVSYAGLSQPSQAEQRTTRMREALQAAIAGPLKGRLPDRIFYDWGSSSGDANATQRFLPLTQALRLIAPDFNLLDPKRGYDLSARLGNTFAASSFAGVGIALLAGWETGGTALIVNLRRDDGASVIALVPPNAAYRNSFSKRPYDIKPVPAALD